MPHVVESRRLQSRPAAHATDASRSKISVRPLQSPDKSRLPRASPRSSSIPITGTSKRISCFGFATFTPSGWRVRASMPASHLLPQRPHHRPGPLDRRVRPLHGLHRNAGLRRHHYRLPDVEPCQRPRHAKPVLDVLSLVLSRRAPAHAPSATLLASSGSRNAVELISSMPSSPSTFATAPSSISVFRVRRFSSSFASRQSGRML